MPELRQSVSDKVIPLLMPMKEKWSNAGVDEGGLTMGKKCGVSRQSAMS
jgi:hypothetical protein